MDVINSEDEWYSIQCKLINLKAEPQTFTLDITNADVQVFIGARVTALSDLNVTITTFSLEQSQTNCQTVAHLGADD